MKRLLSIWCILILCFSLFGYRMVIDLVQYARAKEMYLHIDNESFDPQSLVAIKVPVTLPYYTNANQYEQVRGSVQIAGVVYQYVKRRIYNDSIEYLCLPDAAQTQLYGAREQFFRLAYNLQLHKTEKGSKTTVVKPLLLEYDHCYKWLPGAIAFSQTAPPFAYYKCLYKAPRPETATHPPETGTNLMFS